MLQVTVVVDELIIRTRQFPGCGSLCIPARKDDSLLDKMKRA